MKKKIKPRGLKRSLNRKVFIVATLILPLLHWAVFWLYVNLDGILMAFKDQNTGVWTMDNFRYVWELLSLPGGELNIAFRITFLYFVEGIAILVLNLIVAYFLYRKIRGYKYYRLIYFLPAMISGVVLTTIFQEFIKPSGPLGTIADWLNISLPETGLLATKETATPTMMVYNLWVGFTTTLMMFNSSMARIPADVMEASRLDGCGVFHETFSIILPMIMPMFSTMLLLQFTGIFSASGPVLLFTQGQYETTTISYWMFSQIYGAGGYGGTGTYNLVSAFGLCLTVVAVPLTLGVRKLTDLIEPVEY